MALREIGMDRVPVDEISKYLINETKSKAIKIPRSVYNTICNKLRYHGKDVHISLLMSNAISVAIQFKATGKFRPVSFRKFLYHLLSCPSFNGFLTENEIRDLVSFLSDVPSGYTFNDGNRLWAHSEIGDLITF
jgi:hypothetical protein